MNPLNYIIVLIYHSMHNIISHIELDALNNRPNGMISKKNKKAKKLHRINYW